MFIYCTGTITNYGDISMTARGAYEKGQNVYMWKNTDESYEYVPAIGASGGESVTTYVSGELLTGNKGENGNNRSTGGGGSAHGNDYGLGLKAYDAQINVGSGGNANAWNRWSWVTRYAGGGAGNPGGSACVRASFFRDNDVCKNGTGGLLVIYSNVFSNSGNIQANGIIGRTKCNIWWKFWRRFHKYIFK